MIVSDQLFSTGEEIYKELTRQTNRWDNIGKHVDMDNMRGEKRVENVFDLTRQGLDAAPQAGDPVVGWRFYLETEDKDKYQPFMFAYGNEHAQKLDPIEYDESGRGFYYFHNQEVANSRMLSLMKEYVDMEYSDIKYTGSSTVSKRRFGPADQFSMYHVAGVATGNVNLDEGFTAQDVHSIDPEPVTIFTKEDFQKALAYRQSLTSSKT